MAVDLFKLTTTTEMAGAHSVHIIELELPEQIDAVEFDRLNESLLGALDGKASARWVLDLSQVSYMGSAVLGLMINIRQHIKAAGGKLVLCELSPRLTQIFHTCCMEKLFKIAKTRDEAVRLSR